MPPRSGIVRFTSTVVFPVKYGHSVQVSYQVSKHLSKTTVKRFCAVGREGDVNQLDCITYLLAGYLDGSDRAVMDIRGI